MIKNYGERVLSASPLEAYQLLLRQNNSVISSNVAKSAIAGNVALPANPNRIALWASVRTDYQASSVISAFQILDAGGNVIFEWQLFAKEADVATVTPSPNIYAPFRATVLDMGPIIQNACQIVSANTTGSYLLEVIMAGVAG
jgi:hypothetical protein